MPPPPPKLDRAPRSPRPPAMVLVERCVVFVDELEEIIEEIGGVSLDRYIEAAIRSTSERGAQNEAIHEAVLRRRKVEEDAFAILRKRKASRGPPTVRKEPLPEAANADIYGELFDAIELSSVDADAPPTVTRLTLSVSRPPRHLVCGYPSGAFIAGGHRCFLILYIDSYRPGTQKPGFYLVYNAWANSVAMVPPHFRVDNKSHCDIGAGAVLLCCGKEPHYILAELLLHRSKDYQYLLRPTNMATLFIWASSTGQWVQSKVLLPLPPAAAASQDDDKQGTICSFRADMALPVSFSSICWVDLLTGILVYNHPEESSSHSDNFHFIPLPEECVTGVPRDEQRPPEEHRSMCCIDSRTLKFVSMVHSYNQDQCPMLTTWTLRWPLNKANWKWEKDAVFPFTMQDLWEDPVYKDEQLEPLLPTCPIISTQEPGIIYLSVNDYNDHKHSHVFSLNMGRCRVEAAYKVPADENGIVLHPRIFTSDFSSYLNKTREWEMIHGRRDELYEGPRGTEFADVGESRSNLPTSYTVGVGLSMLKLSGGVLGARRVIPTPDIALGPSSRKTEPFAASFCPLGLQAALDIAMAGAAIADGAVAEAA